MNDTDRIVLAAVLGTVLVLAMLFIMALFLVVNASRRHKHRAAMAELLLERDREVMRAEREATRQTLREVGRELHDNVGQLLTVVQMGMNAVLEQTVPDQRLETARDTLELGIAEVRRLGHDLNTDLWKERSLADAIHAEAVRLERVAQVKAQVILDGTIPDLPADTKTILFRVFQEIINNALKHSHSTKLNIVLSGKNGFSLTVSDDGSGFDLNGVKKHAGLETIRSRCALIAMQADCMALPGKGCTWHIHSTNGNTV